MEAVHKLRGIVKRWIAPWDRMQRAVMVELNATVSMVARESDPPSATITGRLTIGLPGERSRNDRDIPLPWQRARLPIHEELCVHRAGSRPFPGAQPLLWIQLFDDQGVSVTEEAWLGRGTETSRSIHSRAALRMAENEGVPAGTGVIAASDGKAAVRGLWARLELRTFAVADGPSFQREQVWIPLLPSGFRLPEIALIWVSRPVGEATLPADSIARAIG